MSKIIVDLNKPIDEMPTPTKYDIPNIFGEQTKPEKQSIFIKILKIFARLLLVLILIVGGIGGFFTGEI